MQKLDLVVWQGNCLYLHLKHSSCCDAVALFYIKMPKSQRKDSIMDLSLTRHFDQNEKIALLKLLIKIAASNGAITKPEVESLKSYLSYTKLKAGKDFIEKAKAEDLNSILSVFESKKKLSRMQSLLQVFAETHGIDPEFEGKLLNRIADTINSQKQSIKPSAGRLIKESILEFGYLWGKEDINPAARQVFAIIFTLLACIFGAMWTNYFINYKMFAFGKDIEWVYPHTTHTISGILIYAAICFRGFLPKPTNVRTIIFTIVNITLFSYIAVHILGLSNIEKITTYYIFFGLIVLLWLGMKEIIGLVFIGFFILFGVKLLLIDARMDWRALPFMITAFMGISFQSSNFFDEFGAFANSLFKKPDKEMIKESLEITGKQVKSGVKAAAAFSAGI
jgi:hypothetical protein